MNKVTTSIAGLIDFLAKLIICMFLMRTLAIKGSDHAWAQGLGALFF